MDGNYQAPCDWYANRTDIQFPLAINVVESVFWTAFPNRLKIYFSANEKSPYNMTDGEVFHLADFGDVDYSGKLPKFPTTMDFPLKYQKKLARKCHGEMSPVIQLNYQIPEWLRSTWTKRLAG